MQKFYSISDIAKATGKHVENIARDFPELYDAPDAVTCGGRRLYLEESARIYCKEHGIKFVSVPCDSV